MISQFALEATPWSGVLVGAASMVIILGLVADAIEGFRRNELWFPCRFGSINGVFIQRMLVSMSPMFIPTYITSDLTGYNINLAKFVSIMFLITMLAHYLPALGVMSNQELMDNMKGLGVFISWIIFFLIIQTCGRASDIPSFVVIFIIIFLLRPFSIALAVPAFRRAYREQLRRSPSNDLMEEKEHLQFLIASSPHSSACGVICTIFTLYTLATLYSLGVGPIFRDITAYKVIILVQSSGIVLGSITMMFRYFNVTTLSKRCSEIFDVFKVQKHWTEILEEQIQHIRES